MADELKKDEKSTFNEFDDSTEPIESIQKTVEDLKRKIQELSTEEDVYKRQGYNSTVYSNSKQPSKGYRFFPINSFISGKDVCCR